MRHLLPLRTTTPPPQIRLLPCLIPRPTHARGRHPRQALDRGNRIIQVRCELERLSANALARQEVRSQTADIKRQRDDRDDKQHECREQCRLLRPRARHVFRLLVLDVREALQDGDDGREDG